MCWSKAAWWSIAEGWERVFMAFFTTLLWASWPIWSYGLSTFTYLLLKLSLTIISLTLVTHILKYKLCNHEQTRPASSGLDPEWNLMDLHWPKQAQFNLTLYFISPQFDPLGPIKLKCERARGKSESVVVCRKLIKSWKTPPHVRLVIWLKWIAVLWMNHTQWISFVRII